MNLLRDPGLVAVDDVVVACRANAHHHHYSAEELSSTPFGAPLARLAEEREALADRLADALRDHGELPHDVDSERERLFELGDRLRSRFAGRAAALLLRERADDERHLAETARRALEAAVPEPLRPELERVADEAARAVNELDGLHGQAQVGNGG